AAAARAIRQFRRCAVRDTDVRSPHRNHARTPGAEMNLYAIRRREYWKTADELRVTAARSAEVGEEMADDIRWIRTYVVQEPDGTLGTVCIYQGTSVEKVREQAERTGMPADEIVQIVDTVVVRPDPAEEAVAS